MSRGIHYATEDVPILLVVVELDVAFERGYIAIGILDKELLLSLDEHGVSCFTEDIQEGVMLL